MNIEAVQKKHEERLMGMPNVTGIGIGKKGRKDVIKVFVTRKVPESELQPDEVIPKSLEGWETDIEEIGVVTAQNRSLEGGLL